jgi:hypothetical protein
MKLWLNFILLLVISFTQKGHACYFYPYGEDIRFSIFNPENLNYSGFRMYNYTSSYFYNTDDGYSTNINIITDNDLSWYNHCKKSVSISEIKKAVFEIPLSEFNIKSKNLFIRYLYQNKDYETIAYLQFAKEAEKLIQTSDDLWEYDNKVFDKLRNEKIEVAKLKIASVKSTILKKRYYYQIFKILSYTPESGLKTIALFNEYTKKYKTSDFLDNWALYYRMNAEENDIKENYLAAQVFARGTDNKFNIQWHFNKNIPINQVLKFAKTNEEKANIHVLYSFKKIDQNLDNIEIIQKLDSKNIGLSFLILREINKIEDWILTPSYTMYLPVLREDYWENSNEQRILNRVEIDRNYSLKLLNLIKKTDLNKVDNKNFYLLSKSYLEFLTKDYSGSLKTIKSFEKSVVDINLKRQIDIVKALNLIANQEKDKAVILDETKEIIKNEFKNKNYSFLFAIAKELEFLNNKKDASFIISQFEGDDYETGDLYWKSKTGKVSLIDDYYYDWYGYIDAELNTKELESLVSELNKKSTNSFDEWKKNVIKNNFNKINDLMGIKYMRDDNLKMAYVYFSKVSKSHYTNGLFNENPFYKIKGYMNFDKKQTYINLDKASVTLTLMNHLNLSKTIKNKNRDLHYFLAANCYYNMTYYGNSWMMKRISWSNNLAESNMIDEKEYYTCKQAKELYQKAFNLTKSKEFKALCAYMIAKCDARKNEYNLSQQYEKNYFIEQDVLEKLNEKSFRNFKAKYSNDYDEFISNCEIFSQYFNARR